MSSQVRGPYPLLLFPISPHRLSGGVWQHSSRSLIVCHLEADANQVCIWRFFIPFFSPSHHCYFMSWAFVIPFRAWVLAFMRLWCIFYFTHLVLFFFFFDSTVVAWWFYPCCGLVVAFLLPSWTFPDSISLVSWFAYGGQFPLASVE